MRPLAAALAVVLAACAEEAPPPRPPPPAPLARPPPDAGVAKEKPPPDDSFAVILEMGGGSKGTFAVDASGDSKSARATCVTMPGRTPNFRAWKRTGTLSPESIAALWEQLERTEWEVQKSHGRTRDEGSASLTFRRGARVREFLAQTGCDCAASPPPQCCAGAIAIKAMMGLCRLPELNGVIPGVISLDWVDLAAHDSIHLRGDNSGVDVWRDWTEKGQLRVYKGHLDSTAVQALWKELDAADWPVLHEIPEPFITPSVKHVTIERGGVRSSFVLPWLPGMEGAAPKLAAGAALEKLGKSKSMVELAPRTRIEQRAVRPVAAGEVVHTGTCRDTGSRIACVSPAMGTLGNTSCFPTTMKNVFACLEVPDEAPVAWVRSDKPVVLPTRPRPWAISYGGGLRCPPPPSGCNGMPVYALKEGPMGWFGLRNDGGPPEPVTTIFSHAYAPARR